MNIKDFIRAEKANLDTGKWASGHVPKSAFPLSRSKPKTYKFGPEYHWRLVKFDALSEECRIWITLNENKEIFRARFGVLRAGDMTVLCEHEFHASEPGWHCHLTFDHLDSASTGGMRWDKQKWPRIEKFDSLLPKMPNLLPKRQKFGNE